MSVILSLAFCYQTMFFKSYRYSKHIKKYAAEAKSSFITSHFYRTWITETDKKIFLRMHKVSLHGRETFQENGLEHIFPPYFFNSVRIVLFGFLYKQMYVIAFRNG